MRVVYSRLPPKPGGLGLFFPNSRPAGPTDIRTGCQARSLRLGQPPKAPPELSGGDGRRRRQAETAWPLTVGQNLHPLFIHRRLQILHFFALFLPCLAFAFPSSPDPPVLLNNFLFEPSYFARFAFHYLPYLLAYYLTNVTRSSRVRWHESRPRDAKKKTLRVGVACLQ